METLVWLIEAPDSEKVGINISGDGGTFKRICTKLCTGGGKTTVMAMLIAWMICNKVTYPQDKRFTKSILIVAPGLTVKSRLQVLLTGGDSNYYTQFNIVPFGMLDKLRQGKVMIINWQALAWETEEQKDAEQEATIWVSGLDRINNARGILSCYDFSATLFVSSGKKNDEDF